MFWPLSKRKSKERLLKQWVEHGDLSPEQAQLDLLTEEQVEKRQLADDEIQHRKMQDYSMLSEREGNKPTRSICGYSIFYHCSVGNCVICRIDRSDHAVLIIGDRGVLSN